MILPIPKIQLNYKVGESLCVTTFDSRKIREHTFICNTILWIPSQIAQNSIFYLIYDSFCGWIIVKGVIAGKTKIIVYMPDLIKGTPRCWLSIFIFVYRNTILIQLYNIHYENHIILGQCRCVLLVRSN